MIKGHPYLGTYKLMKLNFKDSSIKEMGTILDRFVAAFDDGKKSSGRFRMKINSIQFN